VVGEIRRVSFIQRVITAIVPRSWAEAMEAESRAWQARCEACGLSRSIWELGGIRWQAAGNRRRRLPCPKCGQTTWQRVERG
jgi:hypothetical protein